MTKYYTKVDDKKSIVELFSTASDAAIVANAALEAVRARGAFIGEIELDQKLHLAAAPSLQGRAISKTRAITGVRKVLDVRRRGLVRQRRLPSSPSIS